MTVSDLIFSNFPKSATKYVGLKAHLLISLLLISTLFSAPAQAVVTSDFGPETFIRSTGSPIVETRTFSLPRLDGQHTIQIYNGGLEDDAYEYVSSSVIKLNGTQLFGPKDFNQHVSYLERDVVLGATNQLTVELRGKPNGALIINISGSYPNLAPVITSDPERSVFEDSPYHYAVSVTYDEAQRANLSYQLLQAPSGMVIDPANGVLTWQPENADVGTHPVELQVINTEGLSDSQAFVLTVINTNDVPVITSTAITTATEDTQYNYSVIASDPDAGDSLSYTLANAPAGMTIDGAGNISWTPTNAQVGLHNVTVSVTDSGALSASQSFTITVTNVNDAPAITSTPITTATEDTQYNYSVIASDPDAGDSLSYTLATAPAGMTIDGAGNISWTPTNAQVGLHNVTVSVTDSGALSASQSFTITVTNVNDAPAITSTPITTATEDTQYNYSVIASDPDAGDSLSYSLATAPAGMTIDGAGNISWTPTNAAVGNHAVTVSATDVSGLSDSQSFSITVTNINDAPVITSSPITTATEDTQYNYSVIASDPDAGDSLSYTLTTAPAGMTINTSGLIEWHPGNGEVGSHPITVGVTDIAGATAQQSFSLTVTNVNDAPIITSQAPLTATQDTAYHYPVLAEDADIGDVLNYTLTQAPAGMHIDATGLVQWQPTNAHVGPHTITLNVTDSQGIATTQTYVLTVVNVNDAPIISSNPLTQINQDQLYQYALIANDIDTADQLNYTLSQAPAGMTINTSGLVEWRPGNGEVGSHPITVGVTDIAGATAQQSFSLTVTNVNDAPTITSQAPTSAEEDALYQYALIANDIDEGDHLSYLLELAPIGMTMTATGVISWTPTNADVGTHTITIRVTDSGGLSVTQNYLLTVVNVNDAPMAHSQQRVTEEDTPISITLTGSDSENNPLSFRISTEPQHGTLSGAAPHYIYTANLNYNGEDSFAFIANDGELDSAIATANISILPVNDAPTAADQSITTDEDTALAITLSASDIENDTLSYQLTTQPTQGVLSGTAPNLSYQPNTDANGQDQFTFVVNDGQTGSNNATVSISINSINDQPIITSSPITNGEENALYQYQINAIDPDGNTLSYTLISAPNGMTIDSTGLINWTPGNGLAGSHTIQIQVQDGQGASDTQRYTLTIVSLNGAPVITSTPVAFVIAGDSWTYTLEATDPDGDSLVYSMPQSPNGAVFDGQTNSVLWSTSNLSPGNYTFHFSVEDGNGLFDQQLVTVEILPAERTATHEGTEFWIPVSINAITSSSNGTFDINLVSNGTDTQATIEIPALGITENLSLIANQMATYSINLDEFAATANGFTLNALLENHAIHITADSPISAYFMNQKTSTTDGFLGLPVASLGQEYIAATYIMLGKLGLAKTVDAGQPGAIVTLVATEDNTQVTIDPIMDILPGDHRQIEVGTPIVLTMNRGDVYNLETKGSFKADLTGSMIKADKPISVLGQMHCVYIPVDATACDHIVEQLPPIESLATDYYTVPLWGRTDNGRFWYQEYGDTFRVVAPYDNTAIYIDEVLRARLNQGEYVEFFAKKPQHVRASHPVLMVQYSNGNQFDDGYRELESDYTDPFMVIVPPAAQFLKQYTTNTPARNLAYNFANLLVPTSAISTLKVDGQSIDTSLFGDIPNSPFSYIQLPLSSGSHHIEADEPFGTYIYGYDYFESYGYLGGMALSPARFATSLTLSGDATQTLDNQWCAESTVVDQYARPVNGVRIKFNVTGVSNHDAYLFSDAHGIARYCYRGNKSGVDTVTARLNQLNESTQINWLAGTQNQAPVITSLPILDAVEGQRYTYDLLAEDPEGQALQYTLIEAPAGLLIDATGRMVWPQAAFSLNKYNREKVVVSVSDPLGLETVQRFELSKYVAFNTPPQFNDATLGLTATQGVPYVYNLEGTQYSLNYLKYQVLVNDVDEDAAFVDILSGPAEAYIQRIIAYYTGITRENDPRSCEGCIHYFRWIPQQVGEQSFELGLRDARGGTAEPLAFTVNVAPNLPPQIVGFNPQRIASVGYQYSYVLNVENDVPPHEFDNLDDLKVVFEQAPRNMRYELVRGNGTQKLRIFWTPHLSEVGLNTIRLRVDDRLNSTPTEEFTINVVDNNQPPVIAVGNMPGAEATIPYQYPINASDPDGDALTYSLVIAPEGMTVNSTTGVISWLPSASYNNEQEWLRYVVTDAHGLTAEKSDAVYISAFSNRAPEFIPRYRPKYAKVGVEYLHQALATDREGDNPISYRLSSSASGATIDQQNGTITWTPTAEGSFWLNVSATDSLGNYSSANSETWYVQVVADTAPLDAELQLSPANVIDPGESATLSIVPKNTTSTPQITLTVDGQPVNLDAVLQAQISPNRVGKIPMVATITDGLETITRTINLFVRDPADITPPVIQIHSPENVSDITAPTAIIGTAQDDNLTDVILAYKRAEKPLSPNLTLDDFTILYRGPDAFSNEAIATLDTTLLVNGTYHILLQATDANDLTTGRVVSVNVTGDLKVGNFSFSVEDLNIPVAGIPITVSRTYDSRLRNKNLDFGHGWSINYQNIRLEESDEPSRGWTQLLSDNETFDAGSNTYFNGRGICIYPAHEKTVTIILPSGETEKFRVEAKPSNGLEPAISNPNCYLSTDRTYNLHFVATEGTQSTLTSAEGDSLYLLELDNGDLNRIGDPGAMPISNYTLTTREGYIYHLNQQFGLTQILDPNGNTLTYSDNAIVHSSGKQVTFLRDAQGNITDVIDPTGNRIQYQRDTNGDLTSVIDQNNSTTQYTYNNDHSLLDIIDPQGQPVVKNIYDDTGRLIAQDDGKGNRTDFNHDIAGRFSLVTDRRGNSTQYYYDDSGNITTHIDALGNMETYSYDANGNQLSKTDALGRTSTATFNANDDQLTQADPLGNTVSYTYNSRGQELLITDARGNQFENSYGLRGNLQSITDPTGNTASNEVNHAGKTTRLTDALGHHTDFTYGSLGNKNKQTETDALGNITTYTYDTNGNLLTETRSRLINGLPVDETTSYEYDALNRVIKTIDPQGNINQTEYDAVGNQSAYIDAQGNRTEMTFDAYRRLVKTTDTDSITEHKGYDAEGNLISETDREGRITQYSYDALNRQTHISYPDGTTSQTEYDVIGRVSAEIDANGNRTEYGYDLADRRTSVTDAQRNTTHYRYDADGNLTSQLDANGHSISYQYDALDRRIKTTYHDGSITSNTYDALGRVISKTDQAGITTQYQYDALGRLTAVIDAIANRTEYSYDELGNKLTQKDANGNITQWSYDALGRVLTRTLPMGQIESFSYDTLGNQLTHTDFNGNTTTFEYDSNRRLTRKVYTDLTEERYSYSATGNPLTATDASGTTTYRYDTQDRLIQERQPNGNLIDYRYDANGNRTIVTTTVGTTVETVSYSYDTLNRLATVTDANNQVTTYRYDNLGNRASVSYPNGNVTRYTYDTLNRLTHMATQDSLNNIIDSYDYTLLSTGHRQQIIDHSGATTRYSYDDLYRLIGETLIGHPVLPDSSNSYQYDLVGNRTYSTEAGVSTAYRYDVNDRLLSSGGESYSYDANGNTLTVAIDNSLTSHQYDHSNRLIQMIKTEAGLEIDNVRYSYDIDGLRIAKNDDGIITHYLVDKNRPYGQVLKETNSENQTIVSYTYGDDLISQNRAANDSYYLYDGLGSTRALTDETGAVTDTYDYSAYGTLIDSTGSTENSYLYTGEQFDSSLDNYYLRARYYDPSAGRFTQMDTWAGRPNQPITLNKYLYGNADPVTYTDPTGHFGLSSLGAAMNIQSVLTTISIASSAYDVFQMATGEKGFSARDLGMTILLSRLPSKFVQRFIRKACNKNSFDGEALVATENGLVVIQDIQIGDKVWAYNEETGEKSLQEVIHLIVGEGSKELVDIKFSSGEVITATVGHPFYVQERKEWMTAGDLSPTDKLFGLNGDLVNITSINSYSEIAKVYNLTVNNDHTYYVGKSEVLNHNSSCNLVTASGFSKQLSTQKQARHIRGTKEWNRKRGGYLNSEADAREILDAVHSGAATILGKKKNGDLLVQYRGVQGFNNNPKAGYIDQVTNRFFIKKGNPTSVVPTSPNKSPDITVE